MSAVLDHGTIGPRETAIVRACGLETRPVGIGHSCHVVDRWIFEIVCAFDIENESPALSRALDCVKATDGARDALSVLVAETPDRIHRRFALVAYLESIGALS